MKTADFIKNRFVSYPVSIFLITALAAVIVLLSGASTLYSRESLDGEIAKALRKTVKCERIEIKTNTGDNKSGDLKSLFMKFVSLPMNGVPVDYVTVQYTDPKIDLKALRNANTVKITSYSDLAVRFLLSEQTIKNEFIRTARRMNFHYDKFLIKFSPPYIELEFSVPAGTIPPKNRKLVEKFMVNDRFEGYAALRLEVRDSRIFVVPAKVILNHFLLPMPVLAELQKRVNPIYQIPRVLPFDYTLGKVDLLKQYVFLSN
ncbi:MAG: hypothetical protein A2X58_08775 [Nitrospirae bacterium GWC2_56_14]|nr:MAG: hypothetical protein A2X58_08775 [Nitrospirae bacterium GWC2_56_14]